MITKNAGQLHGLLDAARKIAAEIAAETDFRAFCVRIDPRKFDFSPRMAALVGGIIDYDYGVRDLRGNRLRSVSITSDGFVLANGSQSFLGSLDDLGRNLDLYIEFLTPADCKRFAGLFDQRVMDYRTVRGR